MTTKWFNNLAILSTHKDTINFIDIGNEFAAKYNARKHNLGKFIPSDLLWFMFYVVYILLFLFCFLENIFKHHIGINLVAVKLPLEAF